jgi:hypothetical protein
MNEALLNRFSKLVQILEFLISSALFFAFMERFFKLITNCVRKESIESFFPFVLVEDVVEVIWLFLFAVNEAILVPFRTR